MRAKPYLAPVIMHFIAYRFGKCAYTGTNNNEIEMEVIR